MILDETKLASTVLDGEEETPAPDSSEEAQASATVLDGEEEENADNGGSSESTEGGEGV